MRKPAMSKFLGVVGAAALIAPWMVSSALATEAKATLEGTVGQVKGDCPNLRFVIGETRVVADERTRYEDGSCRDLARDRTVEVEGSLSPDGTLTARKIDFEAR